MKLRVPLFVVAVATLTLACVPLFAHHGTGVAYETEKSVTLKGVVTEWIWANPHCGLLFDVTDESGNAVHWGAELGNPHQESGAGFTKDIFKPGDKITVTGHPAKSGAPRMSGARFTLEDGRTLPEKRTKGNGEAAPEY
jgi:Family of unknown function (DUF6152)